MAQVTKSLPRHDASDDDNMTYLHGLIHDLDFG